jgi:hypothetical protein
MRGKHRLSKNVKELIIMIPLIETKMDGKKMNVIDDLVQQGVFKVEGKQLYELSLYELIKEHMEQTE